MANPNIVNVTTINGITKPVSLTTTSPTAILATTPVTTGTVVKVNAIYVANLDGATAYNITVEYFAAGTTSTNFVYNVSIPVGATLDIISKPIYVTEGDTLRATASAANKLSLVCSYEVIS